jgi:hypothetical protein
MGFSWMIDFSGGRNIIDDIDAGFYFKAEPR